MEIGLLVGSDMNHLSRQTHPFAGECHTELDWDKSCESFRAYHGGTAQAKINHGGLKLLRDSESHLNLLFRSSPNTCSPCMESILCQPVLR